MAVNGNLGIARHLHRFALQQQSAGNAELLEAYLARKDEAAFEALVHRLGPMVLGVCRRILRNEADAEDAFQATFLVLVRKASSIRPRGMISNWLYGVANNTALKAKAMSHKRQAMELEVGTRTRSETPEKAWEDVQAILDEELMILPVKYRVPIVLCDLEGRTIKEASRQLNWPQGTVATRLTEGRKRLARQLIKRGVTLSIGALAGMLSQGLGLAKVPGPLEATTAKAGCLFATGHAAAQVTSAKAAALMEGVLGNMLLTKLKLSAIAVATTIFLGFAFAVSAQSEPPTEKAQKGTSENTCKTQSKSQDNPPTQSISPKAADQTPKAKEDPKPTIDFDAWEKALSEVKSLRLEFTRTSKDPVFQYERKYTGVILFMKPNYMIMRSNYDGDPTKMDYEAYINNGKSLFRYSGLEKTVTEWRLPINGVGFTLVAEQMLLKR